MSARGSFVSLSVTVERRLGTSVVFISGVGDEEVLLRILDGVEVAVDDPTVVFDVSGLIVTNASAARRFVARIGAMRKPTQTVLVAGRWTARRAIRTLCGASAPPLFATVREALDALAGEGAPPSLGATAGPG